MKKHLDKCMPKHDAEILYWTKNEKIEESITHVEESVNSGAPWGRFLAMPRGGELASLCWIWLASPCPLVRSRSPPRRGAADFFDLKQALGRIRLDGYTHFGIFVWVG